MEAGCSEPIGAEDKIFRKNEKCVLTGTAEFAIIIFVDDASSSDGELCNGSTYDSDSYCLGSNPSSPAISLHGQAVKTLPSQGRIMGSIPIGGAIDHSKCCGLFLFSQDPMRFPPRQLPAFIYRLVFGTRCLVFQTLVYISLLHLYTVRQSLEQPAVQAKYCGGIFL